MPNHAPSRSPLRSRCAAAARRKRARASADALAVVPPIGHGPYAVGCSNVAQDFSARRRRRDGATQYWEGFPDGGRAALRHRPAASIPRTRSSSTCSVPNDGELFGRFAGTTHRHVVSLVCYPTIATNPRPDYALPTGSVDSAHAARRRGADLSPDAATRFPVLLFSHGLSGSPHLRATTSTRSTLFASYGYVVVAPFHGDPRIADIDLEDLSDIAYALAALQATTSRCRRCARSRCARRSTSCSRDPEFARRASTRTASAASARASAANRCC